MEKEKDVVIAYTLLLIPVEHVDKSHYERIGWALLENEGNEWIGGQVEKEFTII